MHRKQCSEATGIEFIVAVDSGNVIGNQGKLPWGYLPKDMERFKKITEGQMVVIGFTTLLSIKKELKGREVVVFTQSREKLAPYPWCKMATSAKEILEVSRTRRVIIAGGESIYKIFLPEVKRIYLTKIETSCEGDKHFPVFLNEWKVVDYDYHKADENNKFSMSFQLLLPAQH